MQETVTIDSAHSPTSPQEGIMNRTQRCMTLVAAIGLAASGIFFTSSASAHTIDSPGPVPASATAPTPHTAAISGYNLINMNSGKCLDVEFGGQFDFNAVDQYTCHNDPIKMWNLTYVSSADAYMLANANSGKCLDVEFGGRFDFNAVDQYTCSPDPIKLWKLNNVSTGVYTLSNVNSGKCLDVEFGGQFDFNAVDQYTCTGSPIQQWKLAFVTS
jgi:ricin-type beta-trefoil lectin protein